MRDVPGLVYSDVDVASGASLAGLDDVFSDDEDFALADDSTIKVDVVCRYPIGRIPHEVHIRVYVCEGWWDCSTTCRCAFMAHGYT